MSVRSGFNILITRRTQSYKSVARRHLSSKSSDPLRILFCGADEFSIASLQGLYKEHLANPTLIKSIDVVCKRGKRYGRGLKQIREVPISATANELSLPLHQIDTFTKWQPPTPSGEPVNLIIAVSFGLLIPPRILGGAKYGGINVHPSLLPDFRGAAPIHHALLSRCTRTGITLQTLHPRRFDQGAILMQTLQPGLSIPRPEEITPSELSAFLAPLGAELLVQGLRDGVHVSSQVQETAVIQQRPAPKVSPEDRHVIWNSWTAEEILLRHRVIGPLWSMAETPQSATGTKSRIIWSSGFHRVSIELPDLPPGVAIIQGAEPSVYIRTIDGHTLRADTVKVEGMGNSHASQAMKKAGMLSFRSKLEDEAFHNGIAHSQFS